MNRAQYVDLVINFLLNCLIHQQFKAFSKGFYKVILHDLHLIHTDEELSKIFGQSDDFCITDLQKSVVYARGYTERTLIIIHLWEILKSLPMDIQRNFLFFCTASDRVPVGSLSKIRLIISRSGGDSTHLPTAQTCFNTLHLPEYSSKEKLRTLLLKAMENATGFGFA
uniref:HECT-type E3 ubiquitin transferase n=1 Tax=Lygus hesperus TaxID=30085 RepID=A0A0A9X980_LYGHE